MRRKNVMRATGATICATAGCSEPLPKGGAFRWCSAHEAAEYRKLMGRSPPRPRGTPLPVRPMPKDRRLPRLESRVLEAIRRGTATTAAITREVDASQARVSTALRWLEYLRTVERMAAGVYRLVNVTAP